MPRGLPISTFVDITTDIQAGGVLRTEFGTGLLITIDDALPAGGPGKAQVFNDRQGVQEVTGAGDALDDAAAWFSRSGGKIALDWPVGHGLTSRPRSAAAPRLQYRP